jgi:peptidoglycan/LPS O-acetylase OafA/YrhL
VLFNAGLLSSSFAVAFLELATCKVALATGTYYLVEKPALRIKHRWVVLRTAVASDDNQAPVQPKDHSPAFSPGRSQIDEAVRMVRSIRTTTGEPDS